MRLFALTYDVVPDFKDRRMPFREAHRVTGQIIAQAAAAKVPLHELPLTMMQAIEPRISKGVIGVLSVESSLQSRQSYGGTAPENVRGQAKRWLEALEKENEHVRHAAAASCCRSSR